MSKDVKQSEKLSELPQVACAFESAHFANFPCLHLDTNLANYMAEKLEAVREEFEFLQTKRHAHVGQ